jgi:signal transduction histidine kinase
MNEAARLQGRLERLEHEQREAFAEAQREADALFAQYQLSQLVASGGSPEELAGAIVTEVVRLAGAGGGAMWMDAADEAAQDGTLGLVAIVGQPPAPVPGRLGGLEAAARFGRARSGSATMALADASPRIVVVLWPDPGRELDPEGARIAQLARHELAVALRSSRLREALERERAELSAIVENATDVIVGVDAGARVTRLNPAGRTLLGLDPSTPLRGTCDEVLGCDVTGGHGRDGCPLRRVIASGSPIGYEETAIRGADARPIRMAGSFAPLAAGPDTGRTDGDRRAAAATAILRDVSAARALEELREGFVATVSHELRTPIALIRGYTESLLHLDLEPAERRAMIDRIHEVTGRLTTLVDQILDVTHLDADPVILERSPVHVASLVARLRAELAASGRSVRVELDEPPDLPPLDVDGARIGQVLENIVGNSVKYSAAGTPIRIEVRVADDRAIVAVEDEGRGIPEDERALVIEPFHRANGVRESRIPGTGLGLAICRRLVEAHGGRLAVGERVDGRPGTRVSFDLPLAGTPAARRGSRAVVEAAARLSH